MYIKYFYKYKEHKYRKTISVCMKTNEMHAYIFEILNKIS